MGSILLQTIFDEYKNKNPKINTSIVVLLAGAFGPSGLTKLIQSPNFSF